MSNNLVSACGDCNNFLSNLVFSSNKERIEYLIKCYNRQYKSVLNVPAWSDEELSELSSSLQLQIRAKEALRCVIRDRLDFLVSNSVLPSKSF